MSALFEWIRTYTAHLPATIRPAEDDQRFITAARRALGNTWTPTQAAKHVASHRYAHALNPPVIAVLELERLSQHPPGQPAPRTPHRCPKCPPGTGCHNPATLPPAWAVAERAQLLRQPMATPGLTEDQREQAMTDLIHQQKGIP